MKKTTKFSIYSIKWKRDNWTPPFLAPCDGVALNALLDMSRECPDLQNKYLCQIGTFDVTTGTIKGNKARIVVNKVKGDCKDEISH